MTPPLTRVAPDGQTEYLCTTTQRYYRPADVRAGDGYVWCICTECDTERRVLLYGRTPQPHCYPQEVSDAH